MTYIFINQVDRKQTSIKAEFNLAIQDISMSMYKGTVEEWYEEFNQLLSIVRSTLNGSGFGGTINDMALHLAIRHADVSFEIKAYDAHGVPGDEPHQFTVLSSDALLPTSLVQSSLYELAEGQSFDVVYSRLGDRLVSSVTRGLEILGNSDTLLNFYNKNSFTSLGNKLHAEIFSHPAADFVERNGSTKFNSEIFLKETPARACGVFLKLAKAAFPELDVSELSDPSYNSFTHHALQP
jgi:hypothetical protein